jgi:hypothetical protein
MLAMISAIIAAIDLAAGDHKSSAMTGTAAVIVDSAALPSGL